MQHLSAAFLFVGLVIVINQSNVATADDAAAKTKVDQIADEAKNRAVTIVEGPKYVTPKPDQPTASIQSLKPEQVPPSRPPTNIVPDKEWKPLKYIEMSRPYYYGQKLQKLSPRHIYLSKKPLAAVKKSSNSVYPTVPAHNRNFRYTQNNRVLPSASTGLTASVPSIPKFSTQNNRVVPAASTDLSVTVPSIPKFTVPVQTINGIRGEVVRPPKIFFENTTPKTVTTTTASTTTTTTQRPLRTKRIWPKRIIEKMKAKTNNITSANNTSANTNNTDLNAESSRHIRIYVYTNGTEHSSTKTPTTTRRAYRRVTRAPKVKTTTPSNNFTDIETNDWVPIVPTHYTKRTTHATKPIRHKRSISKRFDFYNDPVVSVPESNQLMYLQSFGLVPVRSSRSNHTPMERKHAHFRRRKPNHIKPGLSGYRAHTASMRYSYGGDLQTEASHHPHVITKIKHHHHHHHHRYVKTVEKKVPFPVEKVKVVEKPVPYPITVEKQVPFPIGIRVPHPVPYKVVEKEYVPKPYPVIRNVPVVKEVKVPQTVTVEKKVPYRVEVPVDRPVPVQVTVEKKVPYPVPVKVLVPQPYPVETKVPYPVEVKVKEPYEVVKHVPVKVPVPQPFPVKVPYPVEVEKKVPVYVPKPYPIEKKVHVKVPYPVKVPVEVPIEVPIYVHYNPYEGSEPTAIGGAVSGPDNTVTNAPEHTVTVHGNSGFAGFKSRSDNVEESTKTTPVSSQPH